MKISLIKVLLLILITLNANRAMAEQSIRLALLGASGLGKSSLLKLLTGIHKPLRGKCLLLT